jgi:hypothetical protein
MMEAEGQGTGCERYVGAVCLVAVAIYDEKPCDDTPVGDLLLASVFTLDRR